MKRLILGLSLIGGVLAVAVPVSAMTVKRFNLTSVASASVKTTAGQLINIDIDPASTASVGVLDIFNNTAGSEASTPIYTIWFNGAANCHYPFPAWLSLGGTGISMESVSTSGTNSATVSAVVTVSYQ